MFPSQRATFDRELQASLQPLPADAARAGSQVGADAAKRILGMREYDGSNYKEPTIGNGFTPSDKPGWWRGDPVSGSKAALGATWGKISGTTSSTASIDQCVDRHAPRSLLN